MGQIPLWVTSIYSTSGRAHAAPDYSSKKKYNRIKRCTASYIFAPPESERRVGSSLATFTSDFSTGEKPCISRFCIDLQSALFTHINPTVNNSNLSWCCCLKKGSCSLARTCWPYLSSEAVGLSVVRFVSCACASEGK